MPPPRQITDWLNTNYPRPLVEPEWLEECCTWITNEHNLDPARDLPAFLNALEHQLLQSSLQDSMQPHTGLPANVGDVNTITTLMGPPVLVEVIGMDDVSTSAFQLDQIRQAREERIRAGVGNEEGEEDGDVDVEGEGPMPQYPRGKLRLQLSDGETVLEALEYRRINELKLTTPHGFKMQLKNVRIQRGMAFLEPTTVTLKGGQPGELVKNQEFNFANGLRHRMGLPPNEPPEPQPEVDPPQPLQQAVAIMRSPLREISPPPSPPLFPQRNDDEDLEPRRRKVPKNNSSSSSIATSRPIAGLPSLTSLGGVSTAHSATLVGNNSTSPHFPFSGPQVNVLSVENVRSAKGRSMGLNLQPTIRQTAPNLPSPPTQEPDEASFDFELLDELDENQPPSKPIANSNKGKGRATDATTTKTRAELSDEFPSSDDYGIGDMNDDFWRELDEAEASADRSSFCAPATTSSSSSGLGSSWSAVGRKTGGVTTRDMPLALSAPLEVITIDSDDDPMSAEDKENVPVPTRHVRRRTEDDWEGFSGGGLTQRRDGRPVVLATNPNDILVLTDSE